MNNYPLTFYRPTMCLPNAHQPGLYKADRVLRRLDDEGFPVFMESNFSPATAADLGTVHSDTYVAAVLSGIAPTGYGAPSTVVARQATWTSGAMIAATRWVLDNPGRSACVPASGFHHAHYDHGAGYCTFNGLLVARQVAAPAVKTLILDGDGHYGDGTDDCIAKRRIEGVRNLSEDLHHGLWKDAIRDALADPDLGLVYYQAGADAHIEDPYGVGHLDDGQWLERDLEVFSTCARRGLPLVWCFAGGYNKDKTIALHAQTFKTATRCALLHRAAASVL